MNRLAVDYIDEHARSRSGQPFSLFFAHKAVHPDAEQAADGTLKISAQGGYVLPPRHENLYKGEHFAMRPNVLPPEEVLKQKPVWAECFGLKQSPRSQEILRALQSGEQEEIRRRAAMMASVDEGIGMILERLERHGQLDNTFIVFLGDNGFFFGEHALGPERRFAYEEGIRSPFVVRYPRGVKAGSRVHDLVICQDIAPTLIELAGGKPGAHIQGRSFLSLLNGKRKGWRKSFLIEYWAENAMPWLVGMTYKAIRTDRHKLIHWVNRGEAGELDELYDLERDPYEMRNLIRSRTSGPIRAKLQRELARLVGSAAGLS
jgi:N-acetylglucosamine-6-sulfatase